jgi:hypothetical protein
MSVPAVLKKPAVIGGGLLIFIVLLFMLNKNSGSSSGGTSYVSTGPTDAQLQAQTAVALAQIDAGKSAGAANASVAVAREQLATDLAKTTIQADLSRYVADKQAGNDAMQLTINAQIAGENTRAQVATTKYLADMNAAVTKSQLDQAERIQANNNNFQLSYAESANQTQEHLALITANLTEAQIAANRDVTMGVLTAQNNQEIARITATRDAAIAATTAQRDVALSQDQVIADRNSAVVQSLIGRKGKYAAPVLETLISGQNAPLPTGGGFFSNLASGLGTALGAAGMAFI